MNPLLWNDSVYSFTELSKQESQCRQFMFDYIWQEWEELEVKALQSPELLNEHFFLHQLMRVSKSGRNYSRDEIQDHVGTMIVAVSELTMLIT